MWVDFLFEHAWRMLALVVLLAWSAFFSGTETAMFSLSGGERFRLRTGGAGRAVHLLLRRPRFLLNTLLLGNMLVNVAYTGIVAVLLINLSRTAKHGWVTAVASLVSLLVLVLFGEVCPKMLAMLWRRRWSTLAAWPVLVISRLLAPLLWVLVNIIISPILWIISPGPEDKDEITANELGALLELSAKRGVITRDANALLQEIVELAELRLGDIMVPRVDMVAYNVNDSTDGLADLFRRTRLRKIPVYDAGIDRILGVVHAKRILLNPQAKLRDLVAPVPFLPEAASVERALMRFRTTRTQMGIVVDEYGGTAGLVTLEDILEEIVGDIPDPNNVEAGPAVRRISATEYVLDGRLGIHEWSDVFTTDLAGRRISTVGGFLASLLGRIPQAGDKVSYHNLRFSVESMQRRRVGKVRLQLMEGAQ